MIAFLKKEASPGEINEWLASTSDPLWLTQVTIYNIQTLIGDGFMVRNVKLQTLISFKLLQAYRLYVVWNKDKRMLCAALVILVASLGTLLPQVILLAKNTYQR